MMMHIIWKAAVASHYYDTGGKKPAIARSFSVTEYYHGFPATNLPVTNYMNFPSPEFLFKNLYICQY
jgi:hypothetical protein